MINKNLTSLHTKLFLLKQQVENLRYFIRTGSPVQGDYDKLAELLDNGDKLDKELKSAYAENQQVKPSSRINLTEVRQQARENQNYDAEYFWRYNN